MQDAGKPVPGATVVATDKAGKEVARAVSDERGGAVVELPQFQVILDVPTADVKTVEPGPYVLTVTAGDKSRKLNVAPKAPMAGVVDLSAAAEPALKAVATPAKDPGPQRSLPDWRQRVAEALKQRGEGPVGLRYDRNTDR